MSERDHLEVQHVDGRIILKRTSKKWEGEAWTGLNCFRVGRGKKVKCTLVQALRLCAGCTVQGGGVEI